MPWEARSPLCVTLAYSQRSPDLSWSRDAALPWGAGTITPAALVDEGKIAETREAEITDAAYLALREAGEGSMLSSALSKRIAKAVVEALGGKQ